MTRLEFVGAAGFTALDKISLNRNGVGIDWALVPERKRISAAENRPCGTGNPRRRSPIQTSGDRAGASCDTWCR